MLSTLLYTSLFVLAPVVNVVAFSVNSPEITSCQDVKITWEAKQAPYDVWIINPENPCADPYIDAGADHTGTSMTIKTAGLPAGLKVQISMQDASGEEAWSDVIEVKAGSDSSCVPKELAALVPQPSSAASSAAASSAASSAAGSAAASGTTLVVTPTKTATPAASASSSLTPLAAAGAAIGNSPNGASANQVSTRVVLLGALVGAFFAF